jgi:hypothetical protein
MGPASAWHILQIARQRLGAEPRKHVSESRSGRSLSTGSHGSTTASSIRGITTEQSPAAPIVGWSATGCNCVLITSPQDLLG